MINRFSFHKGMKGTRFLSDRLHNARSYDRIAGYFNSSLLEFAGEALETVKGKIRIVCNSDLRPEDVVAAQKAEHAQKVSFFELDPEMVSRNAKDRLTRLYRLLSNYESASLEIRVLPNEAFGLIHGKAGVITFQDGRRTSFLGSANDTYAAWNLNYELVWEDDSPEACDWVQGEFDRLWTHPQAVPLAQAVINEVERLVERKELDLSTWKKKPEPAGVLIESPVYREEFGLWPHQKYFIDFAWKTHQAFGARYVLADQVGLGKTVQLGMVAQLVALTGSLPVLVLLPKTLMEQWQMELWDLMEIPTARWSGKHWIDETGYEHTPEGMNPLLNCPRKIGLVSQGLVTRGSGQVKALLQKEWECVIVDEAHRARRKKLPKPEERGPAIGVNPDAECNKLFGFLFKLASRTRSLLLSTATPVQMHPIEAWDLLRLLSEANDHVLGSRGNHWRHPEEALPYLLNEKELPEDSQTLWDWLRNPFPPKWEEQNFQYARTKLGIEDTQAVVADQYREFGRLPKDIQTRMEQSMQNLFNNHHPFLRFIIRRTRKYLEDTVDPGTREPYLKRIEVELIDDRPVLLSSYLKQGYEAAEKFCKHLAKRVKAAGFLKTLLLRRIGSSIRAGLNTVNMMLSTWNTQSPDEEESDLYFDEDEMDYEESVSEKTYSEIKNINREETALLQECLRALKQGLEQKEGADPKLDAVIHYLKNEKWAEDGCILFSQYYDTAEWIGEEIVKQFGGYLVGLYAGSGRSGIWENGRFLKRSREEIKAKVRNGEIKVLIGTDAASEGLNLQALGNLINVDLPWNPTRLEQRKGRIQRIGQLRDRIRVLNLRYKDSVEDKVHQALSGRLQDIHELFGQVPDILKDVWVDIAFDDLEAANKLIEDIPRMNPFDNRYSKIEMIQGWDTWREVLNKHEKLDKLREGWK
ncbi:MAG: hypothetical protein JXD23_05865 [Spirochaetales bacterium]|nr:hypothetical protein [Spirochaetales bacterium]